MRLQFLGTFRNFVAIIALPLFVQPIASAEIEVIDWKGRNAIHLAGTIDAGDRLAIESLLELIDPTQHGEKLILLDSPGGNVGEALKISRLFDTVGVHAVIPSGARCSSSCTTVFIGANYRTIELGGMLGQHSCAVEGETFPECNDRLSDHALEHGVSHGSVSRFVVSTPPNEMEWFDAEEAECWGLTLYPFTIQARFPKSEPCAFLQYFGERRPLNVWRAQLFRDGYRVFFRPYGDNIRDLQISFFCKRSEPGVLLSVDLPSRLTEQTNFRARLVAEGIDPIWREVSFEQLDRDILALSIRIKHSEFDRFLNTADKLIIWADERYVYAPPIQWNNSADAMKFILESCVS